MKFFKKDGSPSHNLHNNNNNNNNNKNINKNKTHLSSSLTKPMYHYQMEGGGRKTTVDDMVLLTKINEDTITENLKKRFMEDKIYTYIGPVLVAVNPFKELPLFGERELDMYQGVATYEVPPHIYALADTMYRNMLIDSENQCVIISGESGAGKTVSAKFIMNYLTKVSHGSSRVQQIKEIILKSNPLLEAFGNAKTTRNNNSSRFGKYIEIQFSSGGEPLGGKISNFLLEKSRVHSLNNGERSFHVFYQLCAGAKEEMRKELGISSPDYFKYLAQTGVYKVDNMKDAYYFEETLNAMKVMGISKETQMNILRIVAAILHMGNISFDEQGNESYIEDEDFLGFPAYLLEVSSVSIREKLVSRVFDSKWGGKSDRVMVTLNKEQAQFTRDAWTKGLYSKLFDYIVEMINKAMVTDENRINLGILDIYGFEIFEKNGFEQFCINYVNEKLQQIFIDLTLKSEQEEYSAEGITWKPIKYFDNKIVCDLIESKKPPGIMSILDDTCATMSAKSEGADKDFHCKMESQVGTHDHYQKFNQGFMIKHYAGNVFYHIENFCEKNRDVLFTDIIEVMQSSNNPLIRSLFPDVIQAGAKGRPTTAGMKIKSQANELVNTLTKCVPHYIRCIKPNETKKPHDWDNQMVKHQVEYLGLKENIRVKRAGFAYRRPFHKFMARYSILTPQTWPEWRGDVREGINIIMRSINMDANQYQIGRTKVFIKDPESLYMIEECRERKLDHYARIIQQAFRKLFSRNRRTKTATEVSSLFLNRKERRENSINRNFHGDYLGMEFRPALSSLIPRKEKVFFALTVDKIDRQFNKSKRELILTKSNLYLIGRIKMKKGPQKGKVVEMIKRKIELENVTQASLSNLQDNLVLIHVRNSYEMLLEVEFKSELIMLLNQNMKDLCKRELPLNFTNSFTYSVKKMRWSPSSQKKVVFSSKGEKKIPEYSSSGNTLTVKVPPGLHSSTRPTARRRITCDVKEMYENLRLLASAAPRHSNASRNQHSTPAPPPAAENTHRKPSTQAPTPVLNQVKNTSSRPQAALPTQRTTVLKKVEGTSVRPSNGVKIEPSFRTHHPSPVRFGATPPPPPSDPAPENQPTIKVYRPPIPPDKPQPPRPRVRALYDYSASDSDELSFNAGDVMDLITENEGGWWLCSLRGKENLCPYNYLEKID